jgi:hypothetical protein
MTSRSKKQKLPSKTAIRKALVEAQFDPKTDLHMSIIAAMHNPRYCEMRATEFLYEIQVPGADPQDKLNKALALIALAKVLRQISEIPNSEPLDGHPESMQRRPNQARGIQK